MIISQTPYRVSFAGGGTDLPAFYRQEFGAVLSTTIDQHIYVTIHRRFESTIRVSYSRTEVATTLDEIQHELVREAMRRVEIDEPMEITTIGDVPSGTGMGSSSSLTVGLLAALHGYLNRVVSAGLLAEQACQIEIDVLGKPIGRQDQYAAAFGGLNYIRFNPDDTVDVEPVPCRAETLAELERHVLLCLYGPDPRCQCDPGAAVGGDRAAYGRAPVHAGPGTRDAPRTGRERGPRAIRGAVARGVGAEAITGLRDQQRPGQWMVRGGTPGGCDGRQASGGGRRRFPAAGCPAMAASGDSRSPGPTARVTVPDRQARQPAHFCAALNSSCINPMKAGRPYGEPAMGRRAKALILAGGLGTRLRPLTDQTPKCLLEIGDASLLDYWVACLVQAGITEARINNHAHAGQVRDHIATINAGGRLRLIESYEPELLGSAGTVTANRRPGRRCRRDCDHLCR